jgi:molybdopterin synthase sulfur carrier subunit
MPTVWIPSLLRPLAGGRSSVNVAGSTVGQVVDALDKLFPGIRDRLCAGAALRPGMSVVVDGHVSTLGLLQPVSENSEIHFLPAIGGGICTNSVTIFTGLR